MKYYLMILIMIMPSIGQSASFDCAKATTKTEKLICSTVELGELDSGMAKKYVEAIAALKKPDANKFRQDQKQWLKRRNKLCIDIANCKLTYKYRNEFIKNMILQRRFIRMFLLDRSKSNVVPVKKNWVVRSLTLEDCRICTSDLYINGEMAVGGTSGIIVSGKFEINFRQKSISVIRLYSDTKVFTGDTAGVISVEEINVAD